MKLTNAQRLIMLITIVLLLIAVSPVIAQETLEPLTGTLPPPDDGGQYVDLISSGVLYIILALLVLLGGSMFALLKSAPPWTQQLVAGIVSQVLEQAKTYTDATPSKLDDAAVNAIIDRLVLLGAIPAPENRPDWHDQNDPNAVG